MTKYQTRPKKPKVVDAVQFLEDKKPWPEGVYVDNEPVSEFYDEHTGPGLPPRPWYKYEKEGLSLRSDLSLNSGDWIVTDSSGYRPEVTIMDNERFQEEYEPVREPKIRGGGIRTWEQFELNLGRKES